MDGYHPSKTTWMNPNIEYLFNTDIIEYDIQDAGYSLICQYKLLPSKQINELEQIGKGTKRHIAIGMLQRDDKEFSKRLTDKFTEIRTLFLHNNNLTDNDIISVKKDAIYTIGSCKKTSFGKVKFRPKAQYSSYIRFSQIQNIELYFGSGIDVKGMSDSSVMKHNLYWMEFFRELFPMIESRNPRVKRWIMQFINKYKAGELDDEYYVEFNNGSRKIDKLHNFQKVIVPVLQIIHREVI